MNKDFKPGNLLARFFYFYRMKKQDLRIVFMGTPDFAVSSLKALIDNEYNVVGVVTAPDKQAGRGRKIKMSAVKQFALDNELSILQPPKLRDQSFIDELNNLRCNLQIVVAFRMLPEVVWSLPFLGTFNLHASLLPQYRGAAPINHAIINGEKITGLTTFFLNNEIDTGKIICQKKVEISNEDSVGTLHDKMMVKGAELVLKTVECILDNKVKLQSQSTLKGVSESLKSAPKLHKEDCRINWENSPITIYNFVRGLSPYPASFTVLSTKKGVQLSVKIFKVSVDTTSVQNSMPGSIITDGKKYLDVITGSGVVSILELQLSGKTRMGISDFLRGFSDIDNYHFE